MIVFGTISTNCKMTLHCMFCFNKIHCANIPVSVTSFYNKFIKNMKVKFPISHLNKPVCCLNREYVFI